MIDLIRQIQSKLNNLDDKIKKVTTKQVGQKLLINNSQEIVDEYFRMFRPSVVNVLENHDVLHNADLFFHDLLELTHKKSTKNIYRQKIRVLKDYLLQLEKLLLLTSFNTQEINFENNEKQIIQTLRGILPSAAAAYEQALIDLNISDRLSWRGPATDLRESLRECLDHLAPDNEVVSEKGFNLEKDQPRPTMKQKVKYILGKRNTSSSVIQTTEKTILLIDEIMASFVRSVYTRSSVSTHTSTDKKEVLRIRELIKVVFLEILSL
jgi:hypothetical protein